MTASVREGVAERFIEYDAVVAKPEDATSIIEVCAEHGAHRVLIAAHRLHADFFDLRTRFAGELLQKLENYGIVVAMVIPTDASHSDRFRQFVAEARRGRRFRVFEEKVAAEEWIGGAWYA
jgi:hypothetical protein